MYWSSARLLPRTRTLSSITLLLRGQSPLQTADGSGVGTPCGVLARACPVMARGGAPLVEDALKPYRARIWRERHTIGKVVKYSAVMADHARLVEDDVSKWALDEHDVTKRAALKCQMVE